MNIIKHSGLVLFLLLCSCVEKTEKQISFALNHANENRIELEKVIDYYKNKNDSLKLQAALYLIKNTPYNFATDGYFVSHRNEIHRLDFKHLSTKRDIVYYSDSLLQKGYRKETPIKYDSRTLSADFLRENIELAFEAWGKPWAKHIGFEDFCHYILPYRIQNEVVVNLRRELMERYLPILDSTNITNSFDACNIINEQLGKEFKYALSVSPFYPTIDETYRTGIGNCDGLCNLTVYIMRALGIPVTMDMTLWPKMDRGHCWCAVLHENKLYSFGPCSEPATIFTHKLLSKRAHIPAKIYRKSFHPIQTKNLLKEDRYKSFVKNPMFEDVTDEYPLKTTTIRITSNVNLMGSKMPIYLCVHNHYEWRVLALGILQNNVCIFENVVGDNVFIAADSPDGNSLRYITEPFFIDSVGNLKILDPDIQHKEYAYFSKRAEYAEHPHTLYYWDIKSNNFIRLPYSCSTDSSQIYDNVPKNALIWFTNPIQQYNQRIAFIENGEIMFY